MTYWQAQGEKAWNKVTIFCHTYHRYVDSDWSSILCAFSILKQIRQSDHANFNSQMKRCKIFLPVLTSVALSLPFWKIKWQSLLVSLCMSREKEMVLNDKGKQEGSWKHCAETKYEYFIFFFTLSTNGNGGGGGVCLLCCQSYWLWRTWNWNGRLPSGPAVNVAAGNARF